MVVVAIHVTKGIRPIVAGPSVEFDDEAFRIVDVAPISTTAHLASARGYAVRPFHLAQIDDLQRAFGSLADIREDPRQAEVLIKGTDYIRCEIRLAKRQEMITKLEDFLRRRSKIALVVRREDIRKASGLMEACEILFGDQAQEKFDEYFAESPA